MAMTVVVTRNASGRIRGFLGSCMCEIAPGIYTAPRINPAVRERVWRVVRGWFVASEDMSILMTWPDSNQVGGQEVRTVGTPRSSVWECNGIYLAKREVPKAQAGSESP